MGCVLCCRSGCKEHLMVTNFMQICSTALISVSHKKGCASLLNSLLLPVPSSQGKHNCRSHLKPGALNLCLWNLQTAFPAQRQGLWSSIAVIALPACADKFLPTAWGSHASTSGTHIPDPWGQSCGGVGRHSPAHFTLFKDHSLCLMFQKGIGWSSPCVTHFSQQNLAWKFIL